MVEAAGLLLVALDILLFFAAYEPLGSKMAAEQKRHRDARQMVRDLQARVDLLDKFQAALPDAAKRLEDFGNKRTPPRRQGFSTAAHLIQNVADASGVKPLSVGYRLDTTRNDPLERLALDVTVQGSYLNLLKFTHALETANDFILVREFTITPLESGALNMRLGADLYVTP
jgi:Tfp pilus assembly protein PilO